MTFSPYRAGIEGTDASMATQAHTRDALLML